MRGLWHKQSETKEATTMTLLPVNLNLAHPSRCLTLPTQENLEYRDYSIIRTFLSDPGKYLRTFTSHGCYCFERVRKKKALLTPCFPVGID